MIVFHWHQKVGFCTCRIPWDGDHTISGFLYSKDVNRTLSSEAGENRVRAGRKSGIGSG